MTTQIPPAPIRSEERIRIGYLYLVTFVAAVGGFLFGYDLSLISGAVIFLKAEWNLSPFWMGAVTGSAILGCPFGPLAGVWLADRFGRNKTLLLSAVLFIISAIGSTLARGMIDFSFWRFLGGIGVGLASTVSPMYIAELAPARLRGRLVVVNQLAIVVGLSLSVYVSYLFSFGGHWRLMFATMALPAAILLVGLFFVPNSPRWLAARGDYRGALDPGLDQRPGAGRAGAGGNPRGVGGGERRFPRIVAAGRAAGPGHRPAADGLVADQRREHDPALHAHAVHGGRNQQRVRCDPQ